MGRGTAAWAVIVMEAVVMVTPLAGREKGCKRLGNEREREERKEGEKEVKGEDGRKQREGGREEGRERWRGGSLREDVEVFDWGRQQELGG